MRIAIDPGHGMGNSRAGVFDPGATKRAGGETFAEADIVLRYGHTLKRLFEEQGTDVFMTRTSSADSAAVGRRARRATEAGCTVYVSLHLNSATSRRTGLSPSVSRRASWRSPGCATAASSGGPTWRS